VSTVLTVILVWVLLSIPISLFIGWSLSRTKRDVPFASRSSLPESIVRVEFTASQDSEQSRKVGS